MQLMALGAHLAPHSHQIGGELHGPIPKTNGMLPDCLMDRRAHTHTRRDPLGTGGGGSRGHETPGETESKNKTQELRTEQEKETLQNRHGEKLSLLQGNSAYVLQGGSAYAPRKQRRARDALVGRCTLCSGPCGLSS